MSTFPSTNELFALSAALSANTASLAANTAVTAATLLQTAVNEAQGWANTASSAVGAVKQIIPFMYQSTTVLTPGAWIGEAFVPVATTFTEWISDVDEGSIQLLVNVSDINVLGPRTITSARDEATINLSVAEFARVSFQVGSVTGSPKRVSSYLIGLPTL